MATSRGCSICLAEEHENLFRTTDLNRATDAQTFHYVRCRACDSITLENVPEEMGRYYAGDYYRIPPDASSLLASSKHDHYKLRIVQDYLHHGRLLEIGPGTGGFAYLASLAGFDVEVIELDRECREFIANELGIMALESSENLEGNDLRTYDVVVMWHVLEHLPDIERVLSNLARHVRPGGYLVVALPNPESLQFRLFGKYWVHLDAPRHVNLIPLASLARALRRHSFNPVWHSFADSGTRYWNRFGWIYSFRNLPAPAIFRPMLRLLGFGMAAASMLLDRLDFSRSAYTLVARRDDT